MSLITKQQILSFERNVRCIDEDLTTEIQLYCYNNCSKDTPEYFNCRGVVFENNNLILQGFPFTIELNEKDIFSYEKELDLNECQFFDSHEGTIIRVFNVKGKWYTSTHRKLNAFKSKWASKYESFGETFTKALKKYFMFEIENNEKYLDTVYNQHLNPEYQYMFLLKPTKEERIVCDIDEENLVYHVGTFIDKKLNLNHSIEKIPKPEKLIFTSLDDIKNYILKINIKKLQGVLAISDQGQQYKIFNSIYEELFYVRNNVPSIRFRYLQLRHDEENINKLINLYPDWEEKFIQLENDIYHSCVDLCDIYKEKFILHRIPEQMADMFYNKLLYMIHNEYKQSGHKTTPTRINDILSVPEHATTLNHLVRRYLEKQKK